MKPKPICAYPFVQQNAKELRQSLTPAERILWERLRDRRLSSLKFRRQHPIGAFIVDFYCPAARLVIEIDGGIHLGAGRSRRPSAARNWKRKVTESYASPMSKSPVILKVFWPPFKPPASRKSLSRLRERGRGEGVG